ncbi:hypothetical protein DSO57_1008969 [Entomophthora muscae]|uniref:Uncharacterized protein n=1 Tax=Entomophthora muscae TaxID=34485 RepID=A0ACC2SW22_9FUNG|nr:hypothetical protein DSO57_1008969 [Entomophthora muscae]
MFYQLWMVHAQIDLQFIPLEFLLLSRAAEAIYTWGFTILCCELSLLSPNDNTKNIPPQICTNPPDWLRFNK